MSNQNSEDKHSIKPEQVQLQVDEVVESKTEIKADSFFSFEETDESETPLDKEAVKKPKTKIHQHTTVDEKYCVDLEKRDDRKPVIAMPTSTIEELGDVLSVTPNVSMGNSNDTKEWVETINDGVKLLRVNNTGLKSLEDENAEYGQSVDHESGKLQTKMLKTKAATGVVVTGEKALMGLYTHTGMGITVRKPLWHSGLWLTIKTPYEVDLIELHRSITQEKMELGHITWGLANSAVAGLISEKYLDLALECFHSTTAKDREDLLDLILLNDLPMIFWQLACAVYPSGFQMSRACISNPEKCMHVTKELVHPAKLVFVNKKALTQEQKNHMANTTSGSMDKESILKYQQQHLKGQKRELKYDFNGNDVKIILRVPTVRQYFESTHSWIDNLNEKVIEIFSIDSNVKDRNNYLNKLSRSSVLRQYSHYVESIDYGNIIEDRETIEKSLDILSSDEVMVDKFLEDVEKYINDTTIALVGVPEYDCPNCHGSQNPLKDSEHTLYKNVIPIDPLMTFFTLHFSKMERLGNV